MKTKTVVSAFLIMFVALQINAQDKPKEEFKPSGKLWGLAFADFSYKLGGDRDSIITFGDAEYAKTKKDFNGVGIRRVYLGYDYNMAPKFVGHLLLEGGDGIVTPGGDRTVLVKAINVEWKEFLPYHTLYVGQVGTQCFNLAEKTWSYRSVEKTMGDARKMLPSNDLGAKISSQFKLDSLGNNKIGYHLQYGSGKGSKPEDNRLKKYYGGIDASLFKGKLLLAVNYDYEIMEVKPILPGVKHGEKNTSSIEAFIGYQHKKFALGVEYINQIKQNEITDTLGKSADRPVDTLVFNQMGLSVFARGTILKDKLYAFARYDMYKKNYKEGNVMPSTAMYYDEAFLTAGIDFTPNKNVHIIPNVWMNTYTDMRTKPATNYDESMKSSRDKYYERVPDLVIRLTIYYVFGK